MRSTAGLPFLLQEGDEVAFVPPQLDVPRRATVSYVNPIDERTAEVMFDDVDGAAAQVLVGSHCLIDRSLVDESLFQEAPGSWEGWTVVDQELGQVGQVGSVIENPGQMLIEVIRPQGGQPALVPVVDEIVVDVDVKRKTVHVALPKGILDL